MRNANKSPPPLNLIILAQNRDLCLPRFHSTPPLGESRRNIATTFGTEKLELFGYSMVKKIEDMLIRFDRIHERDRRTDSGRTNTA